MLRRGPEAISPTAHYTAAVWERNGLSHPAFVAPEGRLLFAALQPTMLAARYAAGATLEGFLVARHRAIDHLLEEALGAGRVSQVVEIAAGMSPRGWHFARSYADRLTYVEADLPAMAARKRRALARAGTVPAHRVVELDAFAGEGERSLAAVVGGLDPAAGLAVITEGLIGYFDRPAVEGLWARIAAALGRFSDGLYLSDIFLRRDTRGLTTQTFSLLLSTFVRGRVHRDFEDEEDTERALRAAGFAEAEVRPPGDLAIPGTDGPGADRVRVIAATVGSGVPAA